MLSLYPRVWWDWPYRRCSWCEWEWVRHPAEPCPFSGRSSPRQSQSETLSHSHSGLDSSTFLSPAALLLADDGNSESKSANGIVVFCFIIHIRTSNLFIAMYTVADWRTIKFEFPRSLNISFHLTFNCDNQSGLVLYVFLYTLLFLQENETFEKPNSVSWYNSRN